MKRELQIISVQRELSRKSDQSKLVEIIENRELKRIMISEN